MLDVYRLLARRVGTANADELADELKAWHDAMVRHERALSTSDRGCADLEECPHLTAAELWTRAKEIFGEEADTLTFLRTRAETRALSSSG
jgi:hypothetical protein